ncbi:MAG: RidA family protein [Bacteroidetes bacterium]|nr:RidA family protein [Bacteroidota bacterium]MBL6962990.1 RidA family protein [Bacteroidota bacterium]
MKKTIQIKDAPKPIGPYSQAILANGMLFISGQIPIDPFSGELITDSIEQQTHQIFSNLIKILAEESMKLSNVVKVSIFLADMNDFKTVNEIYAAYFSENPPARETVEVARLPMNAAIEISLIAVK